MNQINDYAEYYDIFNTFFEETLSIIDNNDKLKECFSPTFLRNIDKHSLISHIYNIPAVSFEPDNENLKDFFINIMSNKNFTPTLNTIFIYAYVGQGKTTYIKHLINVKTPMEETLKHVHYIYIGFTEFNSKGEELFLEFKKELTLLIEDFLMKSLNIKETYEFYGKVFPEDRIEYEKYHEQHDYKLEKFRIYIFKEKKIDYILKRKTEYFYKKYKIKICCVIDNMDQHFKFFTDAENFNLIKTIQDIHSFNVQLIIPLRYSNKGFQKNSYFDSFHYIPLDLSLPDFPELFKKRLKYIKKKFDNELKDFVIKRNEQNIDPKEIIEEYIEILDIIQQNTRITRALYQLSNYLIREFIDIMINIFCSYAFFMHPYSKKIRQEYDSRTSKILFSHIIYAIMLINHETFNENDQNIPIINLFSNKYLSNGYNFIRYHILLLLNKQIEGNHINSIITFFLKFYNGNINEKEILLTINDLVEKKCLTVANESSIENFDSKKIIEQKECSLRITPRGTFHLELANYIEYYEVLASNLIYSFKMDFRSIEETKVIERAKNLYKYLKNLRKAEEALSYKESINYSIMEFKWSKRYFEKLEKALKERFNLTIYQLED